MIWCDSVGRAQVMNWFTLKVIEYVDNTESYTRAISGSSSSEFVLLNDYYFSYSNEKTRNDVLDGSRLNWFVNLE